MSDFDETVREARAARQAGRKIFAAYLGQPTWSRSLAGGLPDSGEIASWSHLIEAIEAAGWRLEHFSPHLTRWESEQAIAIFRQR